MRVDVNSKTSLTEWPEYVTPEYLASYEHVSHSHSPVTLETQMSNIRLLLQTLVMLLLLTLSNQLEPSDNGGSVTAASCDPLLLLPYWGRPAFPHVRTTPGHLCLQTRQSNN